MRCRVVLCSTIQALILASGPLAHGQSAPAQAPEAASKPLENSTIYLRGGQVLRATVIEVGPERELRITLPSGETRVVPRSELLYWLGPGSSKAELEPEPPAEPPLVGPREPATWVHLGGWSASLQRDTTGRGAWTTICSSPCDRDVPTHGTYRVVDRYVGEGMKASGGFVLRAPAGERETVVVNGAWSPGFVAGLLSVSAGAPVSLCSALVIGATTHDGRSSGPAKAALDLTAGAGVAFAVVGTILLLGNLSTSVTQSGSQAADERPLAVDWLPSAPPVERTARGPTFTLPVVTARF